MKALLINCTLKASPEKSVRAVDPGIHTRILDSEILVFATPTWLGRSATLASPWPASPGPTGTRARGRARTTPKPKRVTSGRTQPAGLRRRTSSRSPVCLRASRSRSRLLNEKTRGGHRRLQKQLTTRLDRCIGLR